MSLASEPLGAFQRTIVPPDPLLRVSGDRATILGANRRGELLRYKDGWEKIAQSPKARVLDVAVAPGGEDAVALAFPEALYVSSDAGNSWAKLDAPAIGASRVGVTGDGALLVEGLYESLTIAGGKSPSATRSRRPLDPLPKLEISDAYANASLITSQRAAIDGERYVSLITEANGSTALRVGKIEGELETKVIPSIADCDGRVALRGKYLVVGCVVAGEGAARLSLRRSEDSGASWTKPVEVTIVEDSFAMAVASDGAIFVTGACQPKDRACALSSAVVVRMNAAEPTIRASNLHVDGALFRPAFSFDARSVYVLGVRGKEQRLALFVSHDGGASFTAHAIDRETKTDPVPEPIEDEEEAPRQRPFDPSVLDLDEATSLTPGEDGTIGAVFRARGSLAYVTFDEDGKVERVAAPPSENAWIGGFGRHAIAIASDESARNALFWESNDGGGNWEQQAAPPSLLRDFLATRSALACGASGCLVGDAMARVGWGGSPGASTEPPRDASPPTFSSVFSASLACELQPTTKWATVSRPIVTEPYPPLAAQSMRGRAAWSTVSFDPQSGATSLTIAQLPSSGEGDARITTRKIFPKAASTAIHVAPQAEGYAFVRAKVTVKNGEAELGAPLKNIEVAWENFLDGVSGHGTIPDAGVVEEGDVSNPGGYLWLQTSFLSVTANGVFVLPHGVQARDRRAYWIDASGKVETLKLPVYPDKGLGIDVTVRSETAQSGGQLLGIGIVSDLATMILAAREGASWKLTPTSIAPPPQLNFTQSWHWSYQAKNVGITGEVFDSEHDVAWAYFLGMRPDGTFAPPIDVPTQLDLDKQPKACSSEVRAASPRAESLLEPGSVGPGHGPYIGTRHVVLVTEKSAKGSASTVETLITKDAILHGSPAAPCVASWDAASLDATIHAVISGDLTHSWLFRVAEDRRSYDARAMVCKWEPTVPIPDRFRELPGTFRMR